jgi:hypothetical protein
MSHDDRRKVRFAKRFGSGSTAAIHGSRVEPGRRA